MSEKSILDMMEEDVETRAMDLPSSDKVTDLSDLVARLDYAVRQLGDLEEQVKSQKKVIKKLSEQDIPDLFKEMGNIRAFELDDGRKVSVSEDFSISVRKAEQEECFSWLRLHGKEEIIKRKLAVQFDRGEAAEAQAAATLLLDNDLSFSDTESVHPQTLKASMRGMIEEGLTPPDSFSYYPYQKTVIK